ncbi:unnamed protein product [Blepharisma stoltei]|uniref:Translin-associated factor X-interacting protein 1 N-terminal domain-containing protein n=1 Tax=Blepharisma stoltei TaxID=1481888 RepID=A0AAU9K3Y2_9CILI|nr:unnamed protein product [Blepharisma stoltei]
MQDQYRLPSYLKDSRKNSTQVVAPASRDAKTPKINRVVSEPKLFPATTSNLYKFKYTNPQPDQTYLAKIRPKHIQIDKEKLYEENLVYKHMINSLSEENTKLKTKISQMEHDMQEKNFSRIEALPYSYVPLNNPKPKSQFHLIENLKNSVKELRNELQIRNTEYEELKRSARITKMNEISEELKQYTNECMRLKRLMDELLQDKNNVHDNPGGMNALSAYERLRNEKEQLEKNLKFYQESDRVKTEQIEELKKIISQGDHGVLIIDEEPISKRSHSNKEKNVQKNKGIGGQKAGKVKERENPLPLPKKEEVSKEDKGSETAVQAKLVLKKMQIFLKVNKFQPKEWVSSLTRAIQGILSLEELKKALVMASIPVNNEELQILMRQFGENDNQILCSVLIDELSSMNSNKPGLSSTPSIVIKPEEDNSETISRKDAQRIFEEIQCRLTLQDVKNLKGVLENDLGNESFTFSDLMEIFNDRYLAIAKEEERKEIIKYLLCNKKSIEKDELIKGILNENANWKPLTPGEVDNAIRRVRVNLLEGYDDLLARIRVKFTDEMAPVRILVDEMKIHGFINTPEQAIFCRAQFFAYEKSMDKVPYLQALEDIYNLVSRVYVKNVSTTEPPESYIEEENSPFEENKEYIYSQLEPILSEEEKHPDIESSRTTQETHKTYTTGDSNSIDIPDEAQIQLSSNIEEKLQISSNIDEKIEEDF